MKNSRWTGTFFVTVQDTGGQTGTATWQGDLSFTVVLTPPPQSGGPAMLNKVVGTFKATFATDATDPPMQLAHGVEQQAGVQTGLRLTGKGSAIGNFMGDYDPASNSIDITDWIPVLTQASGTWTEYIGGTNPGPTTTPWSVDAPATPPPLSSAPGSPSAYLPTQSAVQQSSAIGQPGVLTPVLPNSQAVESDDLPSLTLSLNNLGNQAIGKIYSMSGALGPSDFSYTETVTWMFTLVPPKYTIDVQFDPPELDPVVADDDFTSTMTVKVTENGQPSQNRDVDITVCTEIGGFSTDGHLHDVRTDPCDSSRPPGSIDGEDDYDPPVTKTTDNTGTITVTYTSPKAQSPRQAIAEPTTSRGPMM